MTRFLLQSCRLGILTLLGTALPVNASGNAWTVAEGVAVPQQWADNQHLYVKGNVGIPEANLAALEQWLDENAPHWTILLMDSAQGETWTDETSQPFVGMDAVEHALGRQLPNKTAFGQFKHPISGEASGAFFVLFLKERKFSYYASDVYDRNQLGEAQWQGNLDALAIRAMRGGGRIVDAVKDTVSYIDGELKRRFEAAAEAKRRAEAARKHAEQATAALLEEISQRITFAGAKAQEIRRDYPRAAGDLVSPQLPTWQGNLESARVSLAAGDVSKAAERAEQTRAAVETYLKAAVGHASGDANLKQLRQDMEAIKVHEHAAAAQAALVAARNSLRLAEEAHQRAEAAFVQHLEEGHRQISLAKSADQETRQIAVQLEAARARLSSVKLSGESAAATKLHEQATEALAQAEGMFASGQSAAEQLSRFDQCLTQSVQAEKADQLRAQHRAQTAGFAGGGLGAAALGLGWLGNRRRRRRKAQAEELLAQWEAAFAQKTEGLLALLEKTGSSVGNAEILGKSGWHGETERLARQTIADVDQLFVMSSSLDGVLDQARSLVRPRHPWGAGRNFVSGGNYEKAVRLLAEDKVAFGPDDPLRPVLEGKAKHQWQGLLGKREDCEPFSLSFEELNTVFNQRAQRALDSLEKIDQGWLQINPSLEALEKRLDEAEAREKAVHDAGASDQFFLLDPLFDQLLPAARQDQAAAEKMSAKDPVGVLDGPVALSVRKAEDAVALCEAVSTARRELFPKFDAATTSLTSVGRHTAWIGHALSQLSSQANEIAIRAVQAPSREETSQLEQALRNLDAQCQDTLQRNERATAAKTAREAACGRLMAERGRLAQALHLSAEKLLVEKSCHPEEKLDAAREAHLAALVELDRGGVKSATASLEEMESLTHEANAIMDDTAAAFTAYQPDADLLKSETARISGMLAPQEELQRRLETSYAADALIIAGRHLAQNLADAPPHWKKAAHLTEQARQEHAAGLILQAAESHEAAELENASAENLLRQISGHAALLAGLEEENRQALPQLEESVRQIGAMVEHPHTQEPSMANYAELRREISAARAAVEAQGAANHPFAAKDILAGGAASLQRLRGQIQADHALFRTAQEKLQAAAAQLQGALPFVQQAQTDQIPDSVKTTQALTMLRAMEQQRAEADERLQRAHQNWAQLCDRAETIAHETARQRAILAGELEKAEEAMATLRTANQSVRRAAQWSGAHGVSIAGQPGYQILLSAEQALAQGNYDATLSQAHSARQQAERAIEAAEAEVRSRRHAEERRREEQRRRAAAARISSALSFSSSRRSSSFGSSPSSSSRRSSSSGSSRSSFSSGSGTSRSGW